MEKERKLIDERKDSRMKHRKKLEKFRHFGKFLLVYSNIFKVYLVFAQNCEPSLAILVGH